jgi:hypothetical protein
MTSPRPLDEVLDQDVARPEPVLDAARVAGLAAAFVIGVLGVVMLIITGQATDLGRLELAVNGLLTAGAALFAYLAPVWQARKARDQVTPLEDPRDADGHPYGVLVEGGHVGGVGGYVVEPQVDGEPDHAAPD